MKLYISDQSKIIAKSHRLRYRQSKVQSRIYKNKTEANMKELRVMMILITIGMGILEEIVNLLMFIYYRKLGTLVCRI